MNFIYLIGLYNYFFSFFTLVCCFSQKNVSFSSNLFIFINCITIFNVSLFIIKFSSGITVVPDVRIPEREERRPPRQCNLQKGKFITDSSQGPLPHSTQWCRSESSEPKLLHKFIGWAHASCFKRIGYKFAKQFHWSKLLRGRDFPGGFRPMPNFLIGKQRSVLSES